MTTKPPNPGERMVTLDISLVGRDYKVACKEGEEAELREAVALLDRRMREIREGSKSSSTERVAVMAGLNLAHDFLRGRGAPAAAPKPAATASSTAPPAIIDAPAARRRIAGMRSAIEQVLSTQEKLL
jgi:cell division protein ZapA